MLQNLTCFFMVLVLATTIFLEQAYSVEPVVPKKPRPRDWVGEQNEIIKKKRSENIFYNEYEETYIDTIPLNSMEYKLELKADLFTDGKRSVDRLRKAIESILLEGQLVRSYMGKGRMKRKTRKVYFYDTRGTCILANNGYYLRERVSYEIGSRTVDIKYRSRDIEESGDRLVDDSYRAGKQKFEEDIVGIDSLYTHSNKTEIPEDVEIESQALDIYPTLSRAGLTRDHKLEQVGGYTATEYNYALGKIQYDNKFIDPDVKRSKKFKKGMVRRMELTLWYLPGVETPLGAELSWKLKDREGDYRKDVLQNADNLYNKIKGMTEWINPYPESKTLLFYSHAGGFCDSAAVLASDVALTILSYKETLSVNNIGGVHVDVDVLFKGKSKKTVLLPINFVEVLNVKSNMKVRPVRKMGVWYMQVQLDGSDKLHFSFDVYRYLNWRAGLDVYGFPNLDKGQFDNVKVKYQFVNTSVHKINNYLLNVRVPAGYLISRNIRVYPLKPNPVAPDRFRLVKGGIDVGYTLNEAYDHTQAFMLTTGKSVGVSFFMRPGKRNYLLLIACLLIIFGWLYFGRHMVK